MSHFTSTIPSVDSRPEEDDPSAAAAKRNQTTAVILCGVIGALFDLELEKVPYGAYLPSPYVSVTSRVKRFGFLLESTYSIHSSYC